MFLDSAHKGYRNTDALDLNGLIKTSLVKSFTGCAWQSWHSLFWELAS
jgi:hypothetical protein